LTSLAAEIRKETARLTNVQSIPNALIELISSLLSANPKSRPTVALTSQILHDILVEFKVEDDAARALWISSFPQMVGLLPPTFSIPRLLFFMYSLCVLCVFFMFSCVLFALSNLFSLRDPT